MDKVIELKNVQFSYFTEYERVEIFDDLNIEIESGGLITIFGESGSGKSSILNLIAGFLKPQAGQVVVQGREINNFNETEACEYRNKNIGFVYQTFNLISKLTAKENVMLPLIISGNKVSIAEKKAVELMDHFKISHRLNHFPYQLSGGEQQRIAIARAMSNNPHVILADEPTGNLDAKNTEVVKRLLKDIADSGKTIIVVSHDASFKEISKQVINMSHLVNKTACIE